MLCQPLCRGFIRNGGPSRSADPSLFAHKQNPKQDLTTNSNADCESRPQQSHRLRTHSAEPDLHGRRGARCDTCEFSSKAHPWTTYDRRLATSCSSSATAPTGPVSLANTSATLRARGDFLTLLDLAHRLRQLFRPLCAFDLQPRLIASPRSQKTTGRRYAG